MAISVAWVPAAILLSGVLSGVILWAMKPVPDHRRGTSRQPPASPDRFLFREGKLVDRSVRVASAGPELPENLYSWAEMAQWLRPRFPDMPDDTGNAGSGQPRAFTTHRDTDPATISLIGSGRQVCLELHEPDLPGAAQWHQTLLRLDRAAQVEASLMNAPFATCILHAEDGPIWTNAAFRALGDEACRHILSVAPEPDGEAGSEVIALPAQSDGAPETRHLEIRCSASGPYRTIHATDVTSHVQADAMRGTFIQTMTKTFADLAVGLAVFDRDRRLVLFNPAVIELTGLGAEFLSGRPDVMDFFDHLRSSQVLPEPKDYSNWRSEITVMIASARQGRYCEAWNLPTGQTYRITGRPHPDGAVVFLIEDISEEVTLTRRTRDQLEVRQAVIDTIDDPVAVIGPNEVVLFCNRACRALLEFDPDISFADTTLDDLLAVARKRFPDHPFWDHVARDAPHAPGISDAERHHGDQPAFVLLPGGCRMLRLPRTLQTEPVSA